MYSENQSPDVKGGNAPRGEVVAPVPVRRGRTRLLVAICAFAIATSAVTTLWRYLSLYESTDDAQVDGHIASVSSRIEGTIVHVYVKDTMAVQLAAREAIRKFAHSEPPIPEAVS
jgi:membrane fusion protein (multidrug efflux system)